MGLKKSEISEAEPKFSYLGSWHANLIHIDRRKCILFVNDMTLFNFLVPDVSRSKIKDLSGLFNGYLECVLAEEQLSKATIGRIMEEYREIEYANTNSKSILGSMNDLAFHYKYHILSEGGVHSSAIPSIIKKLNHMPMGAIEYKYSIEALKAMYENAKGRIGTSVKFGHSHNI